MLTTTTANRVAIDGGRSTHAGRLVVVSNRVPSPSEVMPGDQDRAAIVGGLVSALRSTMEAGGGLWFGWSGRSPQGGPSRSPSVSRFGGPVELATLDLPENEVNLYYAGFANRTLWPLLHSFPERVVIRRDTYRAYRRANYRFAEALFPILRPDDLVWVHDFHLFHVGEELRQMGWQGKTGFFLHVPFPSADIFSILPWDRHILQACLSYDLVGVHTDRYLYNLADALKTQFGGAVCDGVFSDGRASTRLGVYPIGIEPDFFRQAASQPTRGLAERVSIAASSGRRVLLGVDRLDYTKGIPERLRAFERLLDHNRSLRGEVTLVQISNPSRTRVPEYIQEKDRVERLVGQINGRYSEGDWVPVRYLYRSYPQHELARFYRDADVGIVTPLRDGMNLIAKEFVASQGEDPGVLVLSQFSGAASTMGEALVVNPYDIEATAGAIYQALRMSATERRRRWKVLMDDVCEHTAKSWGDSFRSDLAVA